jgi:dynein intermediate chain
VTSIHPHPATQSKKYKALVLTSSLDWTVKLWTLDNFTTPLLEFTTTSYDYISDVQWSPVHPTVFCTVSSGGALSLWNLSKSTTVPIDSVDLFAAEHEEKTQLVQAGSSKVLGKGIVSTSVVRTLNKIVWSADGSVLLAGDSLGTIHVVRVNSGVFALNSNEDSNFESVVLANAKEAVSSGTSDGF